MQTRRKEVKKSRMKDRYSYEDKRKGEKIRAWSRKNSMDSVVEEGGNWIVGQIFVPCLQFPE